MQIVFVSNYYNHHQSSFSQCLDKLTNHHFSFIATEEMDDERKTMGWGHLDYPAFVVNYFDNPTACQNLIDEADVVIWGSAPQKIMVNRLKQGKLSFLYSERIHTVGYNRLKLIKHAPIMFNKYGKYKNLYLLCASAFASFDYAKSWTFINKAYKWGYFPPFHKIEDIQALIANKVQDRPEILYVSRLIPLKHPELPLQVAVRLRDEKIPFHLTMIGTGELRQMVHDTVDKSQLSDCVDLIDSLSPDEVRRYMDRANIFMFTSDSHEGWGAVMNESMNSGCAVIASSEIGSVPFLIQDNHNGCVYIDGDPDDLYKKIKQLCLDRKFREALGEAAYKTIESEWNAETATKRLLQLIEDLKKHGESERFKTGPCSRAEILKDGWYK